jgi:hypothetical protein
LGNRIASAPLELMAHGARVIADSALAYMSRALSRKHKIRIKNFSQIKPYNIPQPLLWRESG